MSRVARTDPEHKQKRRRSFDCLLLLRHGQSAILHPWLRPLELQIHRSRALVRGLAQVEQVRLLRYASSSASRLPHDCLSSLRAYSLHRPSVACLVPGCCHFAPRCCDVVVQGQFIHHKLDSQQLQRNTVLRKQVKGVAKHLDWWNEPARNNILVNAMQQWCSQAERSFDFGKTSSNKLKPALLFAELHCCRYGEAHGLQLP